jgi:hypothetical protein
MMNHISLMKKVATRPGMYLVEETFDNFIALVTGYDMALEGTFLHGFNDWLWKRDIIGHPQSWMAMPHYVKQETEVEKMEYFVSLLEKFTSEK